MAVTVHPQQTPNPNAMKFNVSRTVIAEGSRSFNDVESAADHPLARRLLAIAGVSSVFMLKDFITLSKTLEADWETIEPEAVRIILEAMG